MKKFLDNPVKAEKVIQRIYSRALFFEEKENLSISKNPQDSGYHERW